MANYIWCGAQADKLYYQSVLTSTMKDSEGIGGFSGFPFSVSWDGTNVPWIAEVTDKLFLQSGLLTATLKTSLNINPVTNRTKTGVGWNGTDTPWSALAVPDTKQFLQSGQFSSTLKTSIVPTNPDSFSGPWGIGQNTTDSNTIFGQDSSISVTSRLILASGTFTTTIKTSVSVTPTGGVLRDIGWDMTDTPTVATTPGDTLILFSGQFSSTIKSSLDVNSIDSEPEGIEGDVSGALNAPVFGAADCLTAVL